MDTAFFTFEGSRLACCRDDRVLFENLSFSLRSGSVLVIEGPNGCGKTSLLRILTGLREADEGELFWSGTSLDELGTDYYRHAVYVGHGDGLKLDLSVEENLKFVQAFGESRTSIDESLLKVGLQGYQATLARFLSAGQKRRLALARLMLLKKPLWILDEPFTSLDKKSIAIWENYIAEHVANQGLVVMTSHHDTNLPSSVVSKITLS